MNKEGKWGKGKSLHKNTYTYTDIAKATGLSENTVRIYAYRGIYSPGDFMSTVNFINDRMKRDGFTK